MRPSRMAHGALTALDARLAISPPSGYNLRVAEFRILGPLEVVGDDGTPIAARRAEAACAPGPAPAARGGGRLDRPLVLALWGETAAAHGRRPSLQNFVSQLRKVLGADTLVTKPPGYVLRVEPERSTSTASTAVLRRRAGARAARAARELLREALDALARPAARRFRATSRSPSGGARLEELRLATVEERIDAELELGRHAELVRRARGARRASTRCASASAAQLMLALYRVGPAGGGARGVPAGAPRARRRARDRPEPAPAAAARRDPAAGGRRRAARRRGSGATGPLRRSRRSAARRAGSCPVLGTDVGELAAQLAERFALSRDGGGRAAAGRAVRRR